MQSRPRLRIVLLGLRADVSEQLLGTLNVRAALVLPDTPTAEDERTILEFSPDLIICPGEMVGWSSWRQPSEVPSTLGGRRSICPSSPYNETAARPANFWAIRTLVAPGNGAGFTVTPNNDPLSTVETRVLELLATGKTSKEIALELGISVHTVGNHRKHICTKRNLHSTAELVAYASSIRR